MKNLKGSDIKYRQCASLSSAEQVNRLVAFLNQLCKIFYQKYQGSWNNVLTTRVERTSSALVECLKERVFCDSYRY
jgi:hypothetical protein